VSCGYAGVSGATGRSGATGAQGFPGATGNVVLWWTETVSSEHYLSAEEWRHIFTMFVFV